MLKQNDTAFLSKKANTLTTNGKVLGIMTFFTVLSQLPQLVDAGYSSIISRAIWVLGFAIVLIINKKVIVVKPFNKALVMAVTLFMFSLLQLVTVKTSLISSLSSCILLSIFILFVSSAFGCQLEEADLEHIAKCYIVAATIMAIDLFFTTLRNLDLSDMVYAYASKNSAGVILFTGFLLTMVYGFKKKKTLNNILCIGAMGICFTVILLLKTRAMIVCFPIVLILFIYSSPVTKKVKGIIIFIAIIAAILLLNEQVYDIVINQVIFNNRKHTLEAISSGRASQWTTLGKNLIDTWLIGDGKTEQESLILTALIQYGVFMGGYIILYALWPLVHAVKRIKSVNSKHMFCLLSISAVYFLDGIFEQLAPFGPGVRCFYLWMLFGIILAKNKLPEV